MFTWDGDQTRIIIKIIFCYQIKNIYKQCFLRVETLLKTTTKWAFS